MAAQITMSPEQLCGLPLSVTQYGQLIDPDFKLNPQTVRSYHNTAHRIMRDCFSADLSLYTIACFCNHERVLKYIFEQNSCHLQKTMITCIVKLLRMYAFTPKCVTEAYSLNIWQSCQVCQTAARLAALWQLCHRAAGRQLCHRAA